MTTQRFIPLDAEARLRIALPHSNPEWRQGLCVWCLKAVPPGRRKWCGQACVDEYLIRSSASAARRVVRRRDHGVCAECGLDCPKLRRVLRRASQRVRGYFKGGDFVEPDQFERLGVGEVRTILADLGMGYVGWPRSLWEADHIRPVSRGGGQCGIENLQTLCIGCHKRKSAEIRKKPNAGSAGVGTAE